MPPATLNLREAANRLGVSIPTVRRLLSRRYLTTLAGIRHKRVTMRSLERYLAGGAQDE